MGLRYDYAQEPIYRRDEDFLFKALSYKQEKLDQNRAKLEQVYSQYANLDIWKENDKQYAQGRLQQVTNFVNRYASGDLTDENLMKYITSNLGNVIDDKVATAVASTKRFKSQLQTWAEAEKDTKSGKYNPLNKQYAMSQPEVQAWLNGEQAGQNYQGNAGFIEYVDVNKLLHENAERLSKTLKASFVRDVNGQFYFQEQETGKRVDRMKLQQALSTVMDDKARRQMRINAWGTYGNLDDNQLRRQYNQYYEAKIASKELDKNRAQSLLNNSTSEQDKALYKQYVDALNQELDFYKANYNFDSIMQNEGRVTLETGLYEGRLMDTMLDAYSFEEVTSRKVNDAHYKSVMYDLELRKQAAREAKDRQAALKASKEEEEGKAPIFGSPVLTTTDQKNLPSVVAFREQQKAETFNNVKNTLTGQGFNDKDVSDILTGLSNVSKDAILNKASVKITREDGSVMDLPLDKDLRDSLLSWKINADGETDQDVLLGEAAEDFLGKHSDYLESKMQTLLAVSTGQSFSVAHTLSKVPILGKLFDPPTEAERSFFFLPTGKYISDGKGGYSYKQFSNEQEAEEYYNQVMLNPETDSDKFSKEMYKSFLSTVSLSTNLNEDAERVLVDNTLTKKALSKGTERPSFMLRSADIYSTGAEPITISSAEDARRVLSGEFGRSNKGILSTVIATTNEYDHMIPGSSTISPSLRRSIKDLSAFTDDDRMLTSTKRVIFPPKSVEAEKLATIAFGESGNIPDYSGGVTLLPNFSTEESRIKGYTIQFTPATDKKEGAKEVEITDPNLISQVVNIAQYSKPVINGNVKGQTFDIGNAGAYFGDPTESSVPNQMYAELNQRVQSMGANVQSYLDEMPQESQEDAAKRAQMVKIANDFKKGNIDFTLVSDGRGGIDVRVNHGEEVKTYKGIVAQPEISLSSITSNPLYILDLQYSAFLSYFVGKMSDLKINTGSAGSGEFK